MSHVSRALASFPQLERDVGAVHVDQVLVVHLRTSASHIMLPLDYIFCSLKMLFPVLKICLS